MTELAASIDRSQLINMVSQAGLISPEDTAALTSDRKADPTQAIQQLLQLPTLYGVLLRNGAVSPQQVREQIILPLPDRIASSAALAKAHEVDLNNYDQVKGSGMIQKEAVLEFIGKTFAGGLIEESVRVNLSELAENDPIHARGLLVDDLGRRSELFILMRNGVVSADEARDVMTLLPREANDAVYEANNVQIILSDARAHGLISEAAKVEKTTTIAARREAAAQLQTTIYEQDIATACRDGYLSAEEAAHYKSVDLGDRYSKMSIVKNRKRVWDDNNKLRIRLANHPQLAAISFTDYLGTDKPTKGDDWNELYFRQINLDQYINQINDLQNSGAMATVADLVSAVLDGRLDLDKSLEAGRLHNLNEQAVFIYERLLQFQMITQIDFDEFMKIGDATTRHSQAESLKQRYSYLFRNEVSPLRYSE